MSKGIDTEIPGMNVPETRKVPSVGLRTLLFMLNVILAAFVGGGLGGLLVSWFHRGSESREDVIVTVAECKTLCGSTEVLKVVTTLGACECRERIFLNREEQYYSPGSTDL